MYYKTSAKIKKARMKSRKFLDFVVLFFKVDFIACNQVEIEQNLNIFDISLVLSILSIKCLENNNVFACSCNMSPEKNVPKYSWVGHLGV